MNKITIVAALLFFAALMTFTACAPGPNTAEKIPDSEGHIAGFFLGLWHGFISPVTFIISIFTKSVRLYEVHNSGFLYNFGFVLGAGLFLSGGILGRKKKKA